MILDFHQKKGDPKSDPKVWSQHPNFQVLHPPEPENRHHRTGGISAIWVPQPWLCGNAFRVAWIGRSNFSDGSSVRGFLSSMVFFSVNLCTILVWEGIDIEIIWRWLYEGESTFFVGIQISYMILYMYDIYKPFMDPKYLLRDCSE